MELNRSKRISFHITPQVGILGGTYFFVTSLAIYTILAPLRMLELGFSMPQIGGVAATAALISLLGQLPGGAFCDRRGQRLPLILSFLSLCIVGIGMILSDTLLLFTISMAFRGLSGSFFWPAGQSYASLLDPNRAALILGRQTGAMAVATISGALLAGYMATFFGFRQAFTLAIGFALMGMILSYLTPKLKEVDNKSNPSGFAVVFKNALQMLTANRSLQLAVFCAFIAAIPIGLSGSFYPVYFVSLGYDERMVGILSALLNLAVLVSGMAFGFLHRRFPIKMLVMASLLGMGFSMVFLAGGTGLYLLIPVVVLQGLALGLAAVLRVSLASECTAARQRGVAIGVVEMGFCVSLIAIPLSFGFALTRTDYGTVFLTLGTILIILGLISGAVFRQAKSKTSFAEAVSKTG